MINMIRQKAFTLIELLVVIAIIGLLTTLVLVNTSGTQGRAKVAKALEYSSQVYSALGSEVIGIWNFDNGTGTIAYDNSGYGNNGIISGALFATDTPYHVVGSGIGKYSLNFDGVDDYVTLSSNVTKGLTAFTVLIWIKPNDASASLTLLGDYRISTDNSLAAEIYDNALTSTWRPRIQLKGATLPRTAFYGDVATALSYGVWSLYGATWDGTAVQLYVNGVADGPSSSYVDTSLLTNPTFTTFIGAYAAGAGMANINGLIDDVRVYGTALTASEIQRHYAKGLEKHQNLATVIK